MPKMAFEEAANVLVNEMGFNRTEVNMALEDSSGDFEKAVQKLLSGAYKPPPYMHMHSGKVEIPEKNPEDTNKKKLYPDVSNVFSGLFHRNKTPDTKSLEATAPSLFDNSGAGELPILTSMPPPYEKIAKESKIKDWEINMDVVRVNNQNTRSSMGHTSFSSEFIPLPNRDERCPVCFNALMSSSGGLPEDELISQKGKMFHRSCFTKKYGPKCAYCCFPIDQADEDHELSGKYLVYKEKDYHVECYEKYAGPRCNYCFNVIIEKPNGEFSGNWVVDKNNQYHVECLQKKMYAIWRAKHS